MKKYLTLALILLVMGGFAQNKYTTLKPDSLLELKITSGIPLSTFSAETPLWEPTPSIIFTTSTDKVFSLYWGNDTLKFTSEIPLDEAAERFFNYLGRHYSTVIDSLKTEIELLKIWNGENRFNKILKDMFDELEKQWLSEQKKELKAIIKCGYQDQH